MQLWRVDAHGPCASYILWGGGWWLSYDAASDLISETDRDNRTRNWEYDNLHRLTAENWMSGGTVVYAINTSYDADNEVTSQSDPDSSDAFTFDGDCNVLSVDNAGTPNVPHVVLTAGYDSANDRTSLAATVNGTADFLNNYTFDADQRLTDETQQGQSGGNGVAPKQITFGYNPLGQFTSIARYDFVGTGPMVDIATAALSYDGANRLTGLAYRYDPATGRWASEDPDGFEGGDANMSRFVGNEVTDATDADGLRWGRRRGPPPWWPWGRQPPTPVLPSRQFSPQPIGGVPSGQPINVTPQPRPPIGPWIRRRFGVQPFGGASGPQDPEYSAGISGIVPRGPGTPSPTPTPPPEGSESYSPDPSARGNLRQ